MKKYSRTPLSGIGKPEPLRSQLAGWRSRRITKKQRLAYRLLEDSLLIAQCHNHY